jgi:hypothetical protein
MNTIQETPYQIALRICPPLKNGTWVKYVSEIPGNTGEIIGHGGVYVEHNVFQHWVYTIVPYGMRSDGQITFTIERPEAEVEVL